MTWKKFSEESPPLDQEISIRYYCYGITLKEIRSDGARSYLRFVGPDNKSGGHCFVDYNNEWRVGRSQEGA